MFVCGDLCVGLLPFMAGLSINLLVFSILFDHKGIVSAMMSCIRLTKLEEIRWSQKAKTMWLKEGGRNMPFFHKVANGRRVNFISQLTNDGNNIVDEWEIKENAIEFFKNLFNGDQRERPLLNNINFDAISET